MFPQHSRIKVKISNRKITGKLLSIWKLSKFFLKILFIYLFRQRGREEETEGEKHQCVVASCVPPTGDLARNPGICSDWELSR